MSLFAEGMAFSRAGTHPYVSAGGPKPATADSRVRDSHHVWWFLHVIPAFRVEGCEFEARLEQYSKRLLKKEEEKEGRERKRRERRKDSRRRCHGAFLEGPVENLSCRAQKQECWKEQDWRGQRYTQIIWGREWWEIRCLLSILH